MRRNVVIELGSVAITVGSAVIAIVIWLFSTFQGQADAAKVEEQIIKRMDAQKTRVDGLQNDVSKIREDVSYIRGMLENKRKQLPEGD